MGLVHAGVSTAWQLRSGHPCMGGCGSRCACSYRERSRSRWADHVERNRGQSSFLMNPLLSHPRCQWGISQYLTVGLHDNAIFSAALRVSLPCFPSSTRHSSFAALASYWACSCDRANVRSGAVSSRRRTSALGRMLTVAMAIYR